MGELVNGLTDTATAADQRTLVGDQIQQVRGGYLAMDVAGETAIRRQLEGEYFLKTARDREQFGRPRDGKLFEYDSLPAGSRFMSPIQWDGKKMRMFRLKSEGFAMEWFRKEYGWGVREARNLAARASRSTKAALTQPCHETPALQPGRMERQNTPFISIWSAMSPLP